MRMMRYRLFRIGARAATVFAAGVVRQLDLSRTQCPHPSEQKSKSPANIRLFAVTLAALTEGIDEKTSAVKRP